MREQDHIQGFLQDKLHDYEAQAPAGLWDAIAKELPKEKNIVPLWATYSAIAAAVAILVLVFWPRQDSSVKNAIPLAERPIVDSQPSLEPQLPERSLTAEQSKAPEKRPQAEKMLPPPQAVAPLAQKENSQAPVEMEKGEMKEVSPTAPLAVLDTVSEEEIQVPVYAHVPLEKIPAELNGEEELLVGDVPTTLPSVPLPMPSAAGDQEKGERKNGRLNLTNLQLDDVVLFAADKISKYKKREEAVSSFSEEDDEKSFKQYRIQLGGLTFTRKIHRKKVKA